MKKRMINTTRIEGVLYQHSLELKVSGPNSKKPGTEFISGNIDDSQLRDSLLKINCVKECLPKPVQISKYQKIIEKYYKIG